MRSSTLSTILIVSQIDNPDEWAFLASSPHVVAARLDERDSRMLSSVVFEIVVSDHDRNYLRVQYNIKKETIPVMSVFAYFTQYTQR